MAEIDWVKLAEEKEGELKELYGRMDDDRKLVELEEFVLLDASGNEVPNAISITLNDPAVFCGNVEAALGSSIEQVIVESDTPTLKTSEIEDVIKAGFAQANNRLSKRGEFGLEPVTDQMMCRRGSGAARVLFQMKEMKDSEGKTVQGVEADIRQWDTRFVAPLMSDDGMAAISYRTTRTKDDIEAEYPRDKYDYPTIGKDGGEVLDIWTADKNIVSIAKQQILEQSHIFGVPPVAYQMVSIGSMLADVESRKRKGESVFFLIRDLIPAINRLVSIAQSLTLQELDAALTQVVPPGGDPSTYGDITEPGANTAVTVPNAIQQVPHGDIKRSAQMLHSIIETRIQRGSLSSTDLGTLNFPLSAVALIELGEGRDKIFLPRLGARGLLKQQIAWLFIKQILLLNVGSIELGEPGHKRTFKTADLKGDYDIKFQYFIKSPQIDIARVSTAAAFGNLMSDHSKRRDIIKMPDPDREEAWLGWEQAELLSPVLRLHRRVKDMLKLADAGYEDAAFEAEILSAEMGVTLKQMQQGGGGQVPSVEREQKPQAPQIPLMGGGGGGGNEQGMSSQAKAAQMQGEPAEQEG